MQPAHDTQNLSGSWTVARKIIETQRFYLFNSASVSLSLSVSFSGLEYDKTTRECGCRGGGDVLCVSVLRCPLNDCGKSPLDLTRGDEHNDHEPQRRCVMPTSENYMPRTSYIEMDDVDIGVHSSLCLYIEYIPIVQYAKQLCVCDEGVDEA